MLRAEDISFSICIKEKTIWCLRGGFITYILSRYAMLVNVVESAKAKRVG